MRRQPLGRRQVGRLVAVQYGRHHFTLAAQREFEVGEQAPNIGALGAEVLARHGVDGGAAEIRTEYRIAAGEIFELESHVHGMRLPGKEDDGLLVSIGAIDLGQFALLAGFDQLEVTQPELVLLEHFQDQAIAVIAGFDAVNGIAKCRGEALDVAEVLEPRLIGVRRHRQGVLGAEQIGTHHRHGPVGLVRLAVGFLSRHPVAEKDIDILVLHRGESHRDGQHGNARRIADAAQQPPGQRRGRRDIGPAHIRKTHGPAARRLRARRCGAGARRGMWRRSATRSRAGGTARSEGSARTGRSARRVLRAAPRAVRSARHATGSAPCGGEAPRDA